MRIENIIRNYYSDNVMDMITPILMFHNTGLIEDMDNYRFEIINGWFHRIIMLLVNDVLFIVYEPIYKSLLGPYLTKYESRIMKLFNESDFDYIHSELEAKSIIGIMRLMKSHQLYLFFMPTKDQLVYNSNLIYDKTERIKNKILEWYNGNNRTKSELINKIFTHSDLDIVYFIRYDCAINYYGLSIHIKSKYGSEDIYHYKLRIKNLNRVMILRWEQSDEYQTDIEQVIGEIRQETYYCGSQDYERKYETRSDNKSITNVEAAIYWLFSRKSVKSARY